MRLSSKVMVGMAMTIVLAVGVLALAARSTSTFQDPAQMLLDGDPIILKGGSLTIECPKKDDCLPFNAATKKHEHKDKNKKIQRIIVRDENGVVLFNGSKANFVNGRPTIEIFFK